MSSPRRRAAIRLAGRFKRLVISQGSCVYCGAYPTTIDHFAPASVIAAIMALDDLEVSGRFLVPTCGECNTIASNRIFPTIAAKRRYIQSRLRWKYRKLLARRVDPTLPKLGEPGWHQQCLELGLDPRDMLVQAALADAERKRFIEARLQWHNGMNNEPARLAGVRFGVKEAGANIAHRGVGKGHTVGVPRKR